MANAKKCDRCGKLYEYPICNDAIQITRDSEIYGSGGERFDLCDECYSELLTWLKLHPEDARWVRRRKNE